MRWLTNNFSLNMVDSTEDYTLTVQHMTKLQFKVETKAARNRLSQMDVCQELGLLPQSGTVCATVGDEIYVAQFHDGVLIFRKITIGEIQ